MEENIYLSCVGLAKRIGRTHLMQ